MNEAPILCYLRGIQRYVIGPMLLMMKPLPKRRISTIGLIARGKKVSLHDRPTGSSAVKIARRMPPKSRKYCREKRPFFI
ncbi:hypothetical protein TNIN_275081 [Trichonephila inaurata madagascariensis]|uniref:Uncharacterized protein n=1 Tax=Trichonephila inaurata madagascariensis TaxID=2747483 RepID=A0A8X6XLB2_9ARAC|nr:hypothetical protein TNIN_275081 [Trichonephila inaurata madagascariensis]